MKYFTTLTQILIAGVLIAMVGPAAGQQAYPSKPIRFIVPFAPGGSTTPVARLVGQKLTESWGQPVIVDNRPGGNTIIGTEALVKSPPDGYTILFTTSNHVINPLLLPNLPYDAIKDFAPVATIASGDYVLVLHPSVPANNLHELIALAKSKPGQLNFALPSGAGVTHLAMELFNLMTGVKMQHISYKGAGQLIVDLIGGQTQLSFQTLIVATPHIQSGRLKAIAVSGETRKPALPRVPTFTEAGLPGFELNVWQGILAPAGTPKAIIDKLSTEIARTLATPNVKERLSSQGIDPFISTPERFAELMKAEMAKFAKIIKTANIKIAD